MGFPLAPLAGQDAPQVPGPANSEQINAPEDVLAAPIAPPFAQRMAQATDNAASQQPPQQAQRPGAWARTILAGVQDALAGFGAGGKVPEGAGGLYGAGAAVRQARERADQQKQQQFENQQKQRQMSREEAVSRATIAHENAATVHDEQLTAQLSEENQTKAVDMGKTALEPLLTAGAPIIQEGVTSTELQNLVQQGKISTTTNHAFPTSRVPTGETDKEGNPLMRTLYTVVGDVPTIKLGAADSRLISDNTQYKLAEGTTMSGLVYGTLITRAKAAQTAQMAVDEQLEKAGLEKSNLDEALEAKKMLPDWNAALAKAKGDVSKALQYMQTDKQMAAKYPDASTLVDNLYGGKFEQVRHNQTEERQRQEEITQKAEEEKLKQTNFLGDQNAENPQEFMASLGPEEQAIVKMIGEGRAPLKNPAYLLARKPEVLEAVAKAYPGFDVSKAESYAGTYQDFTHGKTSEQIKSGATALLHLQELAAMDTFKSRMPRTEKFATDDRNAYDNKVDTIAAELGKFYGNDTVEGRAGYKATLGVLTSGGRKKAIATQARSMSDRLDNIQNQWNTAAPSAAYEAPMPGLTIDAIKARIALDPNFAEKFKPVYDQQGKQIGLTADGKTMVPN